jgi:hypothetical protein
MPRASRPYPCRARKRFHYGVAPAGRRTANTEPLPGSLVTLVAHHARELAREGKAEPGPAVAARVPTRIFPATN